MKVLHRPLLAIIIVLYVTSGWLSLAVIGIESQLNNPQYFASVVQEIKPGLELVKKISLDLADKRSPLLQNVVEESVSNIFSEEWFAEQVNISMAAKDKSDIVIDFSSRNVALTEELTRTLRRRTPQELAMMGLSLAQVKPVVEEMVKELELPDEIAVSEIFAMTEPENRPKLSILQAYRGFLKYISTFGFILLTVVLFCLAGPTEGFRWAGISMLVSALTFLPGFFILKKTAVATLASIFEPFFYGPLSFLDSARVAQAMLDAATGTFVVTGFIFAGIGLSLSLIPFLLARLKPAE